MGTCSTLLIHFVQKLLKQRHRSSSCEFRCLIKFPFSRRYYFGGLGVSVLAFSTQVRGFKPGRSRRIFKVEKILSTPSFGGEVKPSVPCRRFAACKISLNGRGSRHFCKITGTTFSPTVPTSAAGISHVVADVVAPVGEKLERLKSGGKKWQTIPKNLPRMQRIRAIPVA